MAAGFAPAGGLSVRSRKSSTGFVTSQKRLICPLTPFAVRCILVARGDMMTIKEAAAEYGVSTQAIYQRIAKSGKKAKDITEGKNADLTSEGVELLASWFCNDQPQELDRPCQRCQLLERENAALQALNKSLQDQIDAAQADKDRLYTLLSQAQQTQAITVARLPDGKDSFWSRIKKRLNGHQDG